MAHGSHPHARHEPPSCAYRFAWSEGVHGCCRCASSSCQHACQCSMIGGQPPQSTMAGSLAAWQLAVTLQGRAALVLQQPSIQRSWQPPPRSRLRCHRRRAHALPMHAHLEPVRLLSLDGRCQPSAQSHARLCGRLASCGDAAVASNTRAAAASQPVLMAAVATLTAAVRSTVCSCAAVARSP